MTEPLPTHDHPVTVTLTWAALSVITYIASENRTGKCQRWSKRLHAKRGWPKGTIKGLVWTKE